MYGLLSPLRLKLIKVYTNKTELNSFKLANQKYTVMKQSCRTQNKQIIQVRTIQNDPFQILSQCSYQLASGPIVMYGVCLCRGLSLAPRRMCSEPPLLRGSVCFMTSNLLGVMHTPPPPLST